MRTKIEFRIAGDASSAHANDARCKTRATPAAPRRIAHI
jgi:hypothetical protein